MKDFKLAVLSILLYSFIVITAIGIFGKAHGSTNCIYDDLVIKVENINTQGFDIQTNDSRAHCRG